MNKRWKLCRTNMKQSHSSTAGTAEATNLTQPAWCCVQCANCDLSAVSQSTCGTVWISISTHVNSGSIQLKWQPTPGRQRKRNDVQTQNRRYRLSQSDQCIDAKIMAALLSQSEVSDSEAKCCPMCPAGSRSSSDRRGVLRRNGGNGYRTDVNIKKVAEVDGRRTDTWDLQRITIISAALRSSSLFSQICLAPFRPFCESCTITCMYTHRCTQTHTHALLVLLTLRILVC